MYVKVCIGGLLPQRDIIKDKLGEGGGQIEGHVGTEGLGAVC